MYKRITLVCLCLCLLFALSSCTVAASGDGPGGVVTDTLKGVYIHTEQAIYNKGKKEINITLYDDSDKTYTFSMEYMLQMQKDNKWVDVSKGDTIVWVQASFTLAPQHTEEQNLALSIYTDNIAPGQYRIVKPIKSQNGKETYYVTAPFAISE